MVWRDPEVVRRRALRHQILLRRRDRDPILRVESDFVNRRLLVGVNEGEVGVGVDGATSGTAYAVAFAVQNGGGLVGVPQSQVVRGLVSEHISAQGQIGWPARLE